MPGDLGRPSVGPRKFRLPSSGRLAVGGGSACALRDTLCVTSGGSCGGIPEPCSGLSYAWYTGRTHSRRYGAELFSKHLPKLEATTFGDLDQRRKNIRSTKSEHLAIYLETNPPLQERNPKIRHFLLST